jgi:UDP-glucose 4-epimerase
MRILITGAKGFIAGYVIEELLEQGHEVVGIDNYSKYGLIDKSYDGHSHYTFIQGDAKDPGLLKRSLNDCEHFICCAAKIGGISYFHKFAYDLIAENDRITAAALDAAIDVFRGLGPLKKITMISSSMIHESTDRWPSKEGDEYRVPPPASTYGLQKLATHYYCRGAWQQYGLPYTVIVPFNAIGTGEMRAKTGVEVASGNLTLALSHVVPDLVQKILKGQDPLHILGSGDQIRHYTYAGDLAKGIVLSLEHPGALNEEFNIAAGKGHTVRELAALVWRKIKGEKPLRFIHDEPYTYDVQKRIPEVSKAREILGFDAKTSLEEALDEIIPWIERQIKLGAI